MMSVLLPAALAFVLGACLGSFVAACSYRMPRDISIVFPASHCPRCQEHIAWFANVPVLGYVFCRGRCLHCHGSISPLYPLLEASLGLLFAAVTFHFLPDIPQVVWYLSLVFFLFACGVIDAVSASQFGGGEGIIPDFFSVGGLVAGLALAIWFGHFAASLAGALAGGGILLAVYLYYRYVRQIEALGLGDVKMLAMIGAFVGVTGVLYTLFLASLTGLAAAVFFMIYHRSFSLQMKIPFGPFLALGALLVVFVRG